MIPVLEKCFSRKNNAMGIRVAAVEAYRRMPCAADVRDAQYYQCSQNLPYFQCVLCCKITR